MPPKGALDRLTCRATASKLSNSVASTMDICSHASRIGMTTRLATLSLMEPHFNVTAGASTHAPDQACSPHR